MNCGELKSIRPPTQSRTHDRRPHMASQYCAVTPGDRRLERLLDAGLTQMPCSRRISSSEADDQKRSSRFSLVLVIAGVACVRCSVQFDNIIASPGAKLGVRMRS